MEEFAAEFLCAVNQPEKYTDTRFFLCFLLTLFEFLDGFDLM